MKLTSFSIRGEDLVGFGKGATGIMYAVHFDINAWKPEWEKDGLTKEDLVTGKGYCLTSIRNYPKQRTIFKRR